MKEESLRSWPDVLHGPWVTKAHDLNKSNTPKDKPKCWSDGVSFPGYDKITFQLSLAPYIHTSTHALWKQILSNQTSTATPWRWIYQPSHLEGCGPVEFRSVDSFWKYISDIGYEFL